jgi:N-acetylmuramic acid 6-phosphate etherase
MSSAALLDLINDEDGKVPAAVRAVLPALADVVDRAVRAIEDGGRIHYFGAGTSGRFGVLDAAEVPPTYGISGDLVVAHMAGGDRAMSEAVEDAEDSEDAGAQEARADVGPSDIVFGLAASGRTPYVSAALREARLIGAHTIAITSNPDASVAEHADVHLCVETGPEVVTGSTRMKAGTAQKLVLHSFSTALMIRLGRTYSNLMVDVVPTNKKLRKRVIRLLREASGASETAATDALHDAGGDTKTALVMLLTGSDEAQARTDLVDAHGDVRAAIENGRVHERPRTPGTSWLGVDIGASGFRLSILQDQHVVEDTDGTARPRISQTVVELDAVMEELRSRLDTVRQGGIGEDIDGVVVGLAGAAYFRGRNAELAERLRTSTSARSVSITSDIVPAYIGALGFRPGAVLAAGTGAIALGTDLHTVFRRVDGLGHLLGDHGSGAWIGRRGLEAATADRSGHELRSPLLAESMRNRFGDVEQLVAALYGGTDRSALLASFVPDVIAAASAGDPIAGSILDAAAQALAATLLSASSSIDGPRAAVGGLMHAASPIRVRLEERIALAPTLGTPALGAALLARRLRRDELSPILLTQLDTHTEGM